MAWWAMAAGAMMDYNMFALEANKEKAFRASWGDTHKKEAQKYAAQDAGRLAEKNLAKVQSDRQLTLTEEASNHSIREADTKLAMAVNGDSTMAYVGEAALAHQTNVARSEINQNYDTNLNAELGNFRAAKSDFYALNQPYKGRKRKGTLSLISGGIL